MTELTLSSKEFEKEITLAEAYLVMFEFLEANWEECRSSELGAVLGELSLCQNSSGQKLPMDGAVLPKFVEAAQKVLTTNNPTANYLGADLRLQK